jgi:MraZ protein
MGDNEHESGCGELELESTNSLGFRGNFSHTLDTKGRVNLPAPFRAVLTEHKNNSIVLTNYISQGARCLEGFALSDWINFESRLRAKSRFSAKLQQLENFYLSRAAECPVDSAGRIMIPPHLRAYAGIERELTFTSSIHGFRIWERRVWDHIFNAAEAALMNNPDLFADVDI